MNCINCKLQFFELEELVKKQYQEIAKIKMIVSGLTTALIVSNICWILYVLAGN